MVGSSVGVGVGGTAVGTWVSVGKTTGTGVSVGTAVSVGTGVGTGVLVGLRVGVGGGATTTRLASSTYTLLS